MKTCYILVGLPGSGKTTWRHNFVLDLASAGLSYYVITTDDIIEDASSTEGRPYKDVWLELKDELETHMLSRVEYVHNTKPQVVIWDQTNLSLNKRSRIRGLLGPEYRYIEVFFNMTKEEMLKRNDERKSIGRDIPEATLLAMERMLEHPSPSEDFVLKEGRVSEVRKQKRVLSFTPNFMTGELMETVEEYEIYD